MRLEVWVCTFINFGAGNVRVLISGAYRYRRYELPGICRKRERVLLYNVRFVHKTRPRELLQMDEADGGWMKQAWRGLAESESASRV